MPSEKIDCFLDTNVLIYAAQTRARDERRTDIARELVFSTLFGVSAQTLAEFYNLTAHRARTRLPTEQIDRWLQFLSALPFAAVDQAVVAGGISLSRRYGIRYHDAALLAAAERLGAPVFYSEDLNHGQTYGTVRVVNPFKAAD